MIKLNLQLFGGRGSSGGGGGSGGQPSQAVTIPQRPQKLSSTELSKMSREQLVAVAREHFLYSNMRSGLTGEEVLRRFNSLVGGNTTPQLRKYISNQQKR